MASTTTLSIKTASIAISLIASGGIASLSLFDIPELQAQPASRSLPSIRWLFSRGSHIFPQASVLSSAGFAYLAINAIPAGRTVTSILNLANNGSKVNSYLAAAALTFAIGPFTAMVMIPTNFRLIELNERKGGARSERSAKEGTFSAGRTAEESVYSKGDINELTDLSNPQAKTPHESTAEEDEEVRDLLGKFGRLNAVRALLAGAGGIVGLIAALS